MFTKKFIKKFMIEGTIYSRLACSLVYTHTHISKYLPGLEYSREYGIVDSNNDKINASTCGS